MKSVAQSLMNIYRFRGFVVGSVRRDFEQRYVNSLFGALWAIILPLSTILIYVIVFSKLMNARLPHALGPFSYSVYLCSGMVIWGLFSEVMGRLPGVFVGNANLIKKLNFPRICLPVASVTSALINFLITSGVLILVLMVLGVMPALVWWSLVPVVGVLLVFSMGLGIQLAILNVFFRDVAPMFSIVTQLWFWCTPIVYPVSVLPAWLAELMRWNPMAIIVGSFQDVILHSRAPDFAALSGVFVISLALCGLAVMMYRRRVGEMVDEL